MTSWDELVVLAEAELELVRGGDLLALPGAIAARGRLAASLGPAPVSARPALERLVGLQEQLVVELTLARDATTRELGTLRRGRGAVQGYRTAAGPIAGTIDARH